MNIRGHSYDGASAMSSTTTGVQGRIKQISPRVTHIHCQAHVLSLAIGKSSELPQIKNVIGVINSVYLFFDNSPKRLEFLELVLRKFCPETRHDKLKGLCKTRWVERHACLETL